ncbi:MAG: haloacid dehalogenase [Chitinophaga sp.]|nr:haloacid dehalogenase [Chitinophaga sp.]
MFLHSKAFIFDLNGTMINDMDYHTQAWYEIITNELGAQFTREEVAKEMYGKNKEVLARIFGQHHFNEEEIIRLSSQKEKRYQALYKPKLESLPGLLPFLEQSKLKGIKMGIGSAAIIDNIEFVVDGLNIRSFFDSIVGAEHVQESKPHPETFLKVAADLQINPADCIVFEDAPKGVEAALNAGMKCLVITTMHEKEEFEIYPNVIGFAKDYRSLI